jgi:hypothetical protein
MQPHSDTNNMRFLKPICLTALCTLLLLALAGCGTTPINTRAFEERVLDDSYANRMYDYGNDLYAQGRFPEAHAAYLSAENTAYTRALRDASRVRRIYVEKVIASAQLGKPVPPPPYYKPPPPVPPVESQVKPLTSDQEKLVTAEQEAAQNQALQQMYPSYFKPAGRSGSLQESPLGSEPLSQDQADKK